MIKSKVRCPPSGQINYVRKKTYSEKFSEMAAVGEQQQDEDAAELTFPKVTYFGSHLVLT